MPLSAEAFERDGWVLVPQVVDAALLQHLRAALEIEYEQQRPLQTANDVGENTDGTVHHLPLAGGPFLELLDRNFLADVLHGFFGGPYIVNTYGAVLNLPGNLSYVGRIHRDQRTFSGTLPLMAQWLVMLDDFTEQNGATHFLSRSHRAEREPREKDFFRRAKRAIGPAGSIVVFNSNLWHAAGVNSSMSPRRALTIVFSRPFVKQQFDYPRALGYAMGERLSPTLRQLLGYNARVPATLDEWYQP